MFSDKFIIHDSASILFQNTFKALDFIIMKGLNEIGHGRNFWIIPIGSSFLRIKGIDCGGMQHTGQDEIFQTTQPAGVTSFIVAFKGLKECFARRLIFLGSHVHLASQFLNECQGSGMGYSTSNGHGLVEYIP
mmetsp:Transcript_8/g.17  ORF Transcript_8/g.17 Transcript_8/m.17 type:complete len:133 (+) Transcript_8:578-976(+)